MDSPLSQTNPFPWLADRFQPVQQRLVRQRDRVSGQLQKELTQLEAWLTVPLCLWPVDLVAVADDWLQTSGRRRAPEPALTALLAWLGEHPDLTACEVARKHEAESVRVGDYGQFLTAGHKFDEAEAALGQNREFRTAWTRLKGMPGMKTFLQRSSVVRRSPVSERGYRAWLDQPIKGAAAARQRLFDTFCHRWSLYGMHGDRPLLLKPTVNLTPFGTMIFVPSFWSLDPKRDLRWPAVTRLHQLGRRRRQGTALTEQRREKLARAEALQRVWQELTASGLRGEARVTAALTVLGWPPETDERTLRQLRRVPLN
jgi:hypothetical protein